MLSPSDVWPVLGLQTELLEPRWGLNSCRSAWVAASCVVVFVTSSSRTALSLVAADAMLSMIPLKESMNSSSGMAPGGGTVSMLCNIPWMCAAALAEPKESAEGLECQMTRSSASCASWKWDFHFSQVWSSRGDSSEGIDELVLRDGAWWWNGIYVVQYPMDVRGGIGR